MSKVNDKPTEAPRTWWIDAVSFANDEWCSDVYVSKKFDDLVEVVHIEDFEALKADRNRLLEAAQAVCEHEEFDTVSVSPEFGAILDNLADALASRSQKGA